MLVFVCINLAFIGTCLSAEDSWYPKASDSCSKFKADMDIHGKDLFERLEQHPELIDILWTDKLVLNFKTAYNSLLTKNQDIANIFKQDKTAETLWPMIDLEVYCKRHEQILLGDLAAPDVFNEIRKAAVTPKPATPPAPKLMNQN
jgi:hypothetical protein